MNEMTCQNCKVEIRIESAFLVPGSDWYLCEKCWDDTWK